MKLNELDPQLAADTATKLHSTPPNNNLQTKIPTEPTTTPTEPTTTPTTPKPERIDATKLKDYNNKNPLHATWSRVFSRQKYDAKRSGKSWTITQEQAWNIINEQNWRCALSGDKFTPAGGRTDTQASLDRIDSAKGYEPDNIQYVTLRVNWLKREMPQNIFVALCKKIAEHSGD